MTDLSRIISVGVGPIIVISACGLLCLALYNRLAAIVSRVRQYQREVLSEQVAFRQRPGEVNDDLATVRHHEFLGMLRVQIDKISRRARLIRKTLFFMLLTVLMQTLCALTLGLSVLLPGLLPVAAVLFAVGLLSMATGVVLAMLEIRDSLDPMLTEASFVTGFTCLLEDLDNRSASADAVLVIQ